MKLRISAVQVLICCAFVTPTTLLAQSRPVWTLGIAAIGDTSPTQKAETTSDLTPFVQLEWGQLTLDLSSISYQIVETSVFVAVASLNYAPGPEIEGVRRRDFVDLSIGGTFLGETLRHSAVLSTDITDTNAGSLLELSTSSDLGGVSLSAGARVRDDQRTAFIFARRAK